MSPAVVFRRRGDALSRLSLILLCLVLYLPGLAAVPAVDRDEASFAQASRQMVESGDWVAIRFQDQTLARKPVGIYWLQAATAELTGQPDRIWPYRLPSLLGAVAATLLTFELGRLMFGRAAGWFGGAFLAASLTLVVEAHLATADAALLATILAAQLVLARAWLAERDGAPPGAAPAMGFWAAEGAGILLKGPVAPAIALLTIGGLYLVERRLGWLRALHPLPGLALLAVIVLPWAVAASVAQPGFLIDAARGDLLPRLVGGQQAHGAPPGSYLVAMPLLLWPASLFAGPALEAAWVRRREAAMRFALAWIIPAWLVFELVPTKLPHYVLPLLPALALLAGDAVARAEPLVARRRDLIWVAVWSLVGLAIAAILLLAPARLGLTSPPPVRIAGAAAAVAATAVPFLAVRRRRLRAAALVGLAAAAVVYAIVFQAILPGMAPLWIARRLAQTLPSGAPVAVAGIAEPSLVFELGTATRLASAPDAAAFLLAAPGRQAVVSDDQEPAFVAALPSGYTSVERWGEIDGFDYSKGRAVRLGLWRLDRGP